MEAAFGTPLDRVLTARGAVVVGSTAAPRMPARLAGNVAFVGGLEPWVTETNNLVRWPASKEAVPGAHHEAAAPATGRGNTVATRRATTSSSAVRATVSGGSKRIGAAAQTATCGGIADAGLTPSELTAAYGFAGFYDHGDEGQGETIGLIEYALGDAAAVATYQGCEKTALTIYYDDASWVPRWGHPAPPVWPPMGDDPEVAADIEVIAALVPKARVVVYESDQLGTGLAPWELAVSGTADGGLPDVITSSWGSCEPQTDMGSAYFQTEQALFAEAAAQGQTVLVAAGDDGSEGCLGQTNSKALAVDDPASAPGVTAVGGTASDTPTGSQYVWNSRGAVPANCLDTGCGGGGAGGGGGSSIWPRPSYQPASLPRSPACGLGAQGCREIPDVSALAGDPYAQYCSPNVCHNGSGWVGFGGTSLSTPSWGAAVLLSEKLCASNVGFLNPLLYDEPRLLTGLVTAGNNDLTGTNRGLYKASASGGYSMAAGLGYLGAVDLTSGALCGPGNLAPSGGGAGGTAPSPTTTTTTVPVSPTTAPVSPTTMPVSPTTMPVSPTTAPVSPTTMPVSPGPPPPARACSLARNRVLKGTPVAIATSETDTGCAGYWIVSRSGDVATFGSASDYGSLQGSPLTSPIVAATATPDGRGYWLLAANGTVFPFGDAERYRFAGTVSAGSGRDGGRRAAGIAVTPDGKGYWTVDADAVVSAFGDAELYGTLEGKGPNRPVVGIAATSTGKGYWLVSSDGGVFNFGDAKFLGSLGDAHLNSLVVGITADPAGNGYRLVASDGGVFSYGAVNYGGLGADPPPVPITLMAATTDGKGYYLVDSTGDVFACGNAPYLGSAGS